MFTIPQRALDFFAVYPTAKPIYSDEDGNLYLNPYQDKALLDAKRNVKALYQIDNLLNVTEVYNPGISPVISFTYDLLYQVLVSGDMQSVLCNIVEETVIVQDVATIEATIVQAIANSGFTTISVTVQEPAIDEYNMIIVSEDDFVLSIKAMDNQVYTFTQTTN